MKAEELKYEEEPKYDEYIADLIEALPKGQGLDWVMDWSDYCAGWRLKYS